MAEGPTSDRIVCVPETLGWKPCIRGARLSVELILELLVSRADRSHLLTSFPQIGEDGLEAALAFAAHAMRNEVVPEYSISA